MSNSAIKWVFFDRRICPALVHKVRPDGTPAVLEVHVKHYSDADGDNDFKIEWVELPTHLPWGWENTEWVAGSPLPNQVVVPRGIFYVDEAEYSDPHAVLRAAYTKQQTILAPVADKEVVQPVPSALAGPPAAASGPRGAPVVDADMHARHGEFNLPPGEPLSSQAAGRLEKSGMVALDYLKPVKADLPDALKPIDIDDKPAPKDGEAAENVDLSGRPTSTGEGEAGKAPPEEEDDKRLGDVWAKPTGELPDGFPGKKALEEDGKRTWAQVRKARDRDKLLEVPGIGESTAKDIDAALTEAGYPRE